MAEKNSDKSGIGAQKSEINTILEDIKWYQYVFLSIILLAGFFAIFDIHYSYDEEYIDPHSEKFYIVQEGTKYPYPYHADEWAHLGLSMNMMEQHQIPSINPYNNAKSHHDLESGFHALLAAFFELTGLDPILTYQYLPAVFFVLAMASLFLMMLVISRNIYIALSAPAFMILIKNNINILGFWFLVPMTASLFMIFMFFASYFSEGRIRLLSAIFFAASIFVYPLATIIILAVTAIYEFSRIFFDKKNNLIRVALAHKYLSISLAFIGLIFVLIFHKFIIQINWIFRYGWTENFEHTYMPWELYGIIACLLAITGLIYAVWNFKRYVAIISLFAITLFTMIMYVAFRFTFLIPYQRSLFYFMIALAMLSSIGTYFLFLLVKKAVYSIDYDKTKSRNIAAITASIIFLAAIITGFSGYYHVDIRTFDLVQYASEKDVTALLWIKENYPSNTIIMVDMFLPYTVYPLSGMQVVAVPASNVQAGNIDSVQKFFYNRYYADCNSKMQILNQEKAKLVYAYEAIFCPRLKEIYRKDSRYIYEVI